VPYPGGGTLTEDGGAGSGVYGKLLHALSGLGPSGMFAA